MIELGGNIKLNGFKNLDSGSMVILKKIIGNYARKMSDKSKKFEGLEIALKELSGKHPKYEIHSKILIDGKVKTSEITDRNVFVSVDTTLRKLLSTISK